MKFPKTLTIGDFSVVNTSVSNNTFTVVLEKKVEAQTVYKVGNGGIVNGVDTRGILSVIFKDSTGAVINGWIRVAVTDANKVRKQIVLEERTERLSEISDRTKAYLLGETPYGAREDSYIIIEFKADASATVDTSQSTLYLPVTVITQ